MRMIICFLMCVFASGAFADTINLVSFEKKHFSQNGEDGAIEKIFEAIGTTNHYYVEFGTQNAHECNTRYLLQQGWCGLLMDGGFSNPRINLHKEFITAENINHLFAKYGVPEEFDLLSIDIDSNDFYVWHAISDIYRPRVVVIEYNASLGPHEDKVVVYNAQRRWDETNYYGASILALYKLGRLKGYSLVYAVHRGVNLFFIRDDVLDGCPHTFIHTNDVVKIYQPPRYGGHRADPHHRPYVSSEEALKHQDRS